MNTTERLGDYRDARGAGDCGGTAFPCRLTLALTAYQHLLGAGSRSWPGCRARCIAGVGSHVGLSIRQEKRSARREALWKRAMDSGSTALQQPYQQTSLNSTCEKFVASAARMTGKENGSFSGKRDISELET